MKSEQLESPRPAKNTATLHTLGSKAPLHSQHSTRTRTRHSLVFSSFLFSSVQFFLLQEFNLIWVSFMTFSSVLKNWRDGVGFSHMDLFSGVGFYTSPVVCLLSFSVSSVFLLCPSFLFSMAMSSSHLPVLLTCVNVCFVCFVFVVVVVICCCY